MLEEMRVFARRFLFDSIPPLFFLRASAALQGLGLLALLYGLVFIVLTLVSARRRKPHELQASFLHLPTDVVRPFGTVFDRAAVALSVVVPAYNETARIGIMLEEALEYLLARQKRDPTFDFEVIVVDDGSKDGTADFARTLFKEYYSKWPRNTFDKRELRVLAMPRNRGKGGAVIQGVYVARGKRILFADADGATRFSDLDRLELALDEAEELECGLAVASRAHLVADSVATSPVASNKTDSASPSTPTTSARVVKRSPIRRFLMQGFHLVVSILGVSGVKDTQCGFKLLTRRAAQMIIPNMHCERWIFDIELLLIAFHVGIPVVEVSVDWHEVGGTKLSLVRDSVLMLVDLLLIRANYVLRVWRVKVHPPKTISERKMHKIRLQVAGLLEDDGREMVSSDSDSDGEEHENDYRDDEEDVTASSPARRSSPRRASPSKTASGKKAAGKTASSGGAKRRKPVQVRDVASIEADY